MTADEPLTARPEAAALDDHGVGDALAGPVDGGGYGTRAGSPAAVERTGRCPATGTGEPGTAGAGSRTAFTGRVGSLALRAAVEPPRDGRRQRRLALPEIWAAAPVAGPSARIRTAGQEPEPSARSLTTSRRTTPTQAHDVHGAAGVLA